MCATAHANQSPAFAFSCATKKNHPWPARTLTRLMSAASPLATKMSCRRAESTVSPCFVAISSSHSPCPRFIGHVCGTSSVDAPSGMSHSPSGIGLLDIGKEAAVEPVGDGWATVLISVSLWKPSPCTDVSLDAHEPPFHPGQVISAS
jgi:hypothetical protein